MRVILLMLGIGWLSNSSCCGAPSPSHAIPNITFRLFYCTNEGTAFSIQVSNRQYVVTARHVVPGRKQDDEVVMLRTKDKPQLVKVKPIFCANAAVDIVVLAPATLVHGPSDIDASGDGAFLGQDVMLLGFPLSYYNAADDMIVPFVGKGVLSAADTRVPNAVKFFFHATAVNGFSGGPIVFIEEKTQKLKILGVIAGFDRTRYPVLNRYGINSTC